jgi:hypothetical protein
MNELLKYSKDSVKLGFADGGNNFYDSNIASASEQVDLLDSLANNCRWWYEPIFSNENKYLPVSNSSDNNMVSAMDLTEPPKTKKENILLNALLVGGTAIVIYKLLF